ncbi:hypothetical protein BJAS_P1394 [Bathymodiolus japonicus methanotrophic gill symbiont]|uniref:DUF2288 domain-containing protein n=1 Tax=Bathymodiolus japonicus methanotrophic gill symbiont TaxID=113269 RepID=UPI001B788081|nr:DUF2288 domain-containing protein [Bathymodiolus japonicus methanotrophic gill symbiont]GFO71725.1 hypothetical protein BJAS_P1394 [Bathymodiolus japonicus methanotrophic gill symbiont]
MTEVDLSKQKVNQETSKIPWSELQRFFAQGLAVSVEPELDLVDVADAFSKDDKTQVELWMQNQQVHLVTDQQAALWIENDALIWAVVIKTWVLVQAF